MVTDSSIQVDASVVGAEVAGSPLLSDEPLLAVHDAGHRLALAATFTALLARWEVFPTLQVEQGFNRRPLYLGIFI